MVFPRKHYIHAIIQDLRTPIIKVITGMRRSGKSTLLKEIIAHIEFHGQNDDVVISINKEDLQWDFIDTYEVLHRYIQEKIPETAQRIYLCIDEVQLIQDWQKAILHRYNDPRVDIIITGSNAQMLSSELATLLTGRYREYMIYPLSFAEWIAFYRAGGGNEEDVSMLFDAYIQWGSLPAIHNFFDNKELVHHYALGVFNTIVYKDIVARYHVRKSETLLKVMSFLADNVGKIFSNNKVVNQLLNQKLTMSVDTLQDFIGYLRNTYMIFKVPRYDIHGKQLLEIYEKYFLCEIGMRRLLVGFQEGDQTGVLENIVYLELLRRGYEVFIGKVGDQEVDFVAVKEGIPHYFQVTYSLAEQKTIDREFGALMSIRDNHPKTVLSLDTFRGTHLSGIARKNLIDWLLE